MQILPSSPRLPPDQEVQNRPAAAPPKATVSNLHVRLAQPRNEVPQPRKEVPPLEEDGRTRYHGAYCVPAEWPPAGGPFWLWRSHGQSSPCAREDAGGNAAERLQSHFARAPVSWGSRHLSQPR